MKRGTFLSLYLTLKNCTPRFFKIVDRPTAKPLGLAMVFLRDTSTSIQWIHDRNEIFLCTALHPCCSFHQPLTAHPRRPPYQIPLEAVCERTKDLGFFSPWFCHNSLHSTTAKASWSDSFLITSWLPDFCLYYVSYALLSNPIVLNLWTCNSMQQAWSGFWGFLRADVADLRQKQAKFQFTPSLTSTP